MTFEQAFIKIKEKFKDVDLAKFTSELAIQVNLNDEDCGGAFYIQFADGKLFVEPYDYHDNTADITLKKLDFNKLITGKLDIEKALSAGTLYINGSREDVLTISGCIKSPEKKPAAKKAAPTKKPAPKKTTKKTTKAE